MLQCFTIDELLETFGVNHSVGLTRQQFKEISPALIQQAVSDACAHEEHTDPRIAPNTGEGKNSMLKDPLKGFATFCSTQNSNVHRLAINLQGFLNILIVECFPLNITCWGTVDFEKISQATHKEDKIYYSMILPGNCRHQASQKSPIILCTLVQIVMQRPSWTFIKVW